MIDLSKVAIIIPCKNEGIYLKQTVDFMLQTEVKNGAQLIIINDGSQDRSCQFLASKPESYPGIKLLHTKGIGASRARNLGVTATSNPKILVFCDGHIIMQKGWLNTLLEAFDDPEVTAISPGIGSFNPDNPVGYGQSWNEQLEIRWLEKPTEIKEIPLVPGACVAIRREAFERVAGFDQGFNSWGYEDVELSLKLWLFGFRLYVHPGVKIGHKFRKTPPYQVNPVDFLYNRIRMCVSHMNTTRIDKMTNILKKHPQFDDVMHMLSKSDTYDQRKRYLKQRKFSDDWFFDRFDIPF